MALNGALTPKSESSAQASRFALCQAEPYMRIRRRLTRRIRTVSGKTPRNRSDLN